MDRPGRVEGGRRRGGAVLHEPAAAQSVAAAAVDRWWRENADRVRAYLHHRTDPVTADDLVQEVFVLALRRADIVPEPPIGWLLRTAAHVLANHSRSRRRYLGMVERFAGFQVTAPPAEPAAGERAAQTALEALLDGVSVHDREVLTLTAWYGLTPAEAADALGITANAYAVRLHRARTRLAARHDWSGAGSGGAP